MRAIIYSVLYSICIYIHCASAATIPVNDCFIELEYGRLRGETRATALKNTSFCSYKGIPYARPPIEDLRFKDPEVPFPWTGVLDANKEEKSCMQNDLMFGKDSVNMTSEDCLYLNVYTPKTTRYNHHEHKSLPVMVWIHGGGFLFGSGNEEIYGPDFLIEHQVVLVTFNYRVGIFGFLNLGNNDVPGNAGLKDQVAVLTWVKKFIHLFGGNPDKVTIFGESAGAASVQYHMLSNMSKGLFHQAIMQSGSILAPWAFNSQVKSEAVQLGKLLNCTLSSDDDMKSLVNCLRKKTSEVLRSTQRSVIDKEDLKRGLFFTFLPSIEVAGTGKSNFLTSDPMALMKKGDYNKVPSLIGFNNLEGYMFLLALNISGREALLKFNDNSDSLVPTGLGLKENSVQFQEVKSELKKFYFNDQPITWEHIRSFCDLIGDNMVITPVQRTIKTMTKTSNKPIYTYEFAVSGNRGPMKILVSKLIPVLSNLTGASHFDDIGYLFNFHVFGEMPVVKDSIEAKTITRITTLWTNFAKTGNPNDNGFNGWEPQQVNEDRCLHIEESSMNLLRSSCEPKRTQFWDHIYDVYSSV